MTKKINETFLSDQESIANFSIEHHEPSEMFPAMGPSIPVCAHEVVSWVCYTRHLSGTAIDLLADKRKAEKQLKETQYLSTLWIKALTSVMPKKMQRRAMGVAGQAIAKGMQEAGMDEYAADFTQLEQQINPE